MPLNGDQPPTGVTLSDRERSCERPDLPNKRRNAGSTPERFRPVQLQAAGAEPRLPVAAAGDTSAQLPFEARHDGQAAPCPGTSKWSVRSIFMSCKGTPKLQPSLQSQGQQEPQHAQPAWPAPPSPGCGPGWGDDGAGPLTQMAAANAPVAAAFCATCGCFMADLGGAAEQAQHAQSCGQRACSAAGTPPRGEASALCTQQEQAASVAVAEGAAGGPAELSWDDDGEQGGNWSEHEEAAQAAPGGHSGSPASDPGLLAGCEVGAAQGCGAAEEVVDLADEADAESWAEEEAAAGGGGEDQAALAAWLEQQGLAKYTSHFVLAGGWAAPSCGSGLRPGSRSKALEPL